MYQRLASPLPHVPRKGPTGKHHGRPVSLCVKSILREAEAVDPVPSCACCSGCSPPKHAASAANFCSGVLGQIAYSLMCWVFFLVLSVAAKPNPYLLDMRLSS